MDGEDEEKLAYRELIAIHAGKLKGELKEAFRGEHELDKVRRVSLTEQSLEKAIDQSYGHGITRYICAYVNNLRIYLHCLNFKFLHTNFIFSSEYESFSLITFYISI